MCVKLMSGLHVCVGKSQAQDLLVPIAPGWAESGETLLIGDWTGRWSQEAVGGGGVGVPKSLFLWLLPRRRLVPDR